MNLTKLFKMQKVLDAKIVKQKGLEGVDLLDKKILALLTELGELANEWRGFKFWSEDQEPTKPKTLWISHEGRQVPFTSDPLLQEYVDCLHFILSIGLEIRAEDVQPLSFQYENIVAQFNELFADVSRSYEAIGIWSVHDTENNYLDIFNEFIGLGEMLGFTWDQIEQAYMDKNKENHARQANGY